MVTHRALFLLLLWILPGALSGQSPPPPYRGPRATVGGQLGYSRSSLGGADALKGGRAQAAVVGGGTVDIDIGLAYLEFPALLRAERPTGRFRPVVFAGPAAALKIGCDLQVIEPSFPLRAECDQTDLPDFRDFDLSAVGGAGLEVRWPASALSLEARYTVGFRSVLNEADVRNRAFGLLLAMTF